MKGDGSVGGCLAEPDTEPLLGVCREGVRPDRLTRFGAADLDVAVARRRGAQVAVEGEDTMDLGTRQVELVGDERDP